MAQRFFKDLPTQRMRKKLVCPSCERGYPCWYFARRGDVWELLVCDNCFDGPKRMAPGNTHPARSEDDQDAQGSWSNVVREYER